MREQLIAQYNIVFDEEGNIKACGRDACKKMISLCEEYTGIKDKYGNPETGVMNVEEIKAFFNV